MCKRKSILLFLLLFLFTGIFAQNYSVSVIPDSLLENANSVVRQLIEETTLKSVNSGTTKVKMVITILNKEGKQDALILLPYDKNSSVNIKRINLYDGNGEFLKKGKMDDVYDFPAVQNFALYSEDRMKYFVPETGVYPYTIEYEYEQTMKNMISYGGWRPILDYNMSTVNSKFILNYPKSITVNRKQINFSLSPTVSEKDNIVTEIWEMNNLRAIEDEPFDLILKDRTPQLYLMPTKLVYENYTGTANTWNEYGMWVNSLFQGRDEISETEKIKLNPIINSTSDTLEKIKILYEYMQNNTRYVAITLGIGGYQPFDAISVFENGYGECKALSNYMHALLKYAGIESIPALVSAGSYINTIIPDFPNFSQFNHVILCVPYKKDTIWLECTSQKIPFGFLGDFTDDREVLLLTDYGGKFAHTKKYHSHENQLVSKSKFIINSNGSADCTTHVKYTGLEYYDVFNFLTDKYEDQKKWLLEKISLPSPQIKNFAFTNTKNIVPEATITQTLTSANYASFTGNYMLVPINLINVQAPIQKMLKPRISDVLIQRSSINYDTITFQIPVDYEIESVPQGKSINSAFGEYSFNVTVNENQILYTRRLEIKQGRHKPEEYKNLFDFVLAISKADNAKIMLVKKPQV